MSELTTNLNNILDIKGNIKSAIENKGVDMTGVSFPGYASKIGEITTSFVTVPLNVSVNGTYTPGEGVDGYSQVVVDVPQSVTGFTEKEVTEGIQIVNLSNSASYVHPYVFEKDNYLQTVNLPNCISVGENAFAFCSNLSSVYLPNCEYIGSSVFYICSSLTQVNLPMCSYIGRGAFGYCTSLSIITIGYSSVCSLNNLGAFSNTQITSSTGSIYVPTSLVDAYKSAPNWSYFSTQIFPIPE